MPYISAIEGEEQAPRIMGGTRVSLFTLDDDEFFSADPEVGIADPYTYDTLGDKVCLEHTDIDKLLDWLEVCVDAQITRDYLAQGKMPYVNVEIFTHNDLYGVSINASSVGEETKKLAYSLIHGPEDEEEDDLSDDYDDDEEGIVIEQWEDPPIEEDIDHSIREGDD